MFAAFDGNEPAVLEHLSACGRGPSAIAHENAVGNAQADCFAGIAQFLIGRPEAAIRLLPQTTPTPQTRAMRACVRELAELGPSLGPASAAGALERLATDGQEGLAQALAVALALRKPEDAPMNLTEAERRVLAMMVRGATAVAIAREHGRSVHTVRNQIKAVIRKLGASSSIEAVARAKHLGPDAKIP